MREEELETLETIRRKAAERRDLEEQRIRLSSVYRSPNLNGMPRGSAGGSGIERQIDAKDLLERRIEKLNAEIETLTRSVHPQLLKLPPHLYALVSTYYLSALSVDDTCRVLDRKRTTFFRHKRELEEWGKRASGT